MNVSMTRDADAAIRTLDADDRIKMSEWVRRLGDWETDERLRKMVTATVDRDIFALNTTDDFRIFFALNETKSEIVVVDLSRPSRFKLAGAASE